MAPPSCTCCPIPSQTCLAYTLPSSGRLSCCDHGKETSVDLMILRISDVRCLPLLSRHLHPSRRSVRSPVLHFLHRPDGTHTKSPRPSFIKRGTHLPTFKPSSLPHLEESSITDPRNVFLASSGCSGDVLINILLWILGWIPGVLHAWWIISKHETPAARY